MKCRAGVLHGVGQEWTVEEIEVDPPKADEVLVQWTHAGLCHSDEHLVTGDTVPPAELLAMMGSPGIFPAVGGHEGSGIVAEVGPGVTSVRPGDHVSASFIPRVAPAVTARPVARTCVTRAAGRSCPA